MQQIHQEKKSKYNKLALKFITERQLLEKKSNNLQNDWLSEEKKYYQLNVMNEISKAKLERAKMEDKWQSGKDKLLPEFKSIQELYENKVQQQENLTKQLLKQQRNLIEHEKSNVQQKELFQNLQYLLTCKIHDDETCKNVFKTDEQLLADTVDVGNAQILCL